MALVTGALSVSTAAIAPVCGSLWLSCPRAVTRRSASSSDMTPATVAATNSRVVYASISGFGSTGGASLPGYDLIVQAMSGLMSLTGSPDGEPYRAGISVFDVMSGMQAAIGILAALRHREAAGEGQHGDARDVARIARAPERLDRGRDYQHRYWRCTGVWK